MRRIAYPAFAEIVNRCPVAFVHSPIETLTGLIGPCVHDFTSKMDDEGSPRASGEPPSDVLSNPVTIIRIRQPWIGTV